MKYSSQFFTIIAVSIFLLIAAIGVNSLFPSGALMAQDGDLPYQRKLPKEFYDDDDNEEQESVQPEDEEQEESRPENEDLSSDMGTVSDKVNEAAQTEKVEVELNAALIKNVQAALNKKINIGLKEDGILGKKTAVAIKKFQKTNGLKETGVLNKITLIKLDITK